MSDSLVSLDQVSLAGAPIGTSGWFRRDPLQCGIVSVSLRFGTGAVAVLGAPADGTEALFDVLVGKRKPDKGKVLVVGAEPSRSSAIRLRIGSVSRHPELPSLGQVRTVIEQALSLRGQDLQAEAVLGRVGANALLRREVSSLNRVEARSVELALCLSIEAPALLVLFEPFADLVGIDRKLVLDRLLEIAETATVVVLTANPVDADLFGGGALTLVRGVVARGSREMKQMGAFQRGELHLWVAPSSDAPEASVETLRAWVKLLSAAPDLLSVSFDAGADGSGMVRVAGPDREKVALAVTDSILEAGVTLAEMREAGPTLAEINLTTEWIGYARQMAARAAYDDVYAARRAELQAGTAASTSEGPPR